MSLGLCSDMLSRLKGIETYFGDFTCMIGIYRSDMLSRLKGIETLLSFLFLLVGKNYGFRYAFPFEGN